MKKIKYKLLMLFTVCFLGMSSTTYAAFDPDGDIEALPPEEEAGPEPLPPSAAPIDMYLPFLVVLGGTIAYRKLSK